MKTVFDKKAVPASAYTIGEEQQSVITATMGIFSMILHKAWGREREFVR